MTEVRVPVCVRLRADSLVRVDVLAGRFGWSRSQMLRQALAEGLKVFEDRPASPMAEATASSAVQVGVRVPGGSPEDVEWLRPAAHSANLELLRAQVTDIRGGRTAPSVAAPLPVDEWDLP